MKLRCIIVDDDLHSINGLKSYINNLSRLEIIQIYTDPLRAMEEIAAIHQVDIIFMDVDMPVISGIELARAIRHKTDKLIFTTSHTKFAYEAFELHANDFLLKPFTIARFAECINRLFPRKDLDVGHGQGKIEDHFFVRNKNDNNGMTKVRYKDIIAVESLQNYIRIFTISGQVITYMSLTEIKEVLKDQPNFTQVHRSFIVSQEHISKVDGNTLFMVDGMELTIGKLYREQMMEYLRLHTIKTNRL